MSRVPHTEVATKDRLEELIAMRMDVRQMAAALKIHPDSVKRALRRHGLSAEEGRPRVSFEEHARMEALSSEGMISTWIAEDVGRGVKTVLTHVKPKPEHVREWKAVWQQIRRSDVLLELHAEFAPRREIHA